jgi:alcohol dehydrogenase
MRNTWNFFCAGQLHFGIGAVKQLGEIAARSQVDRVFIVTDPALVNAGLLDRVKSPLEEAGLWTEVFDGGEPEPSIDAANRAVEAARAFGPDCILGLGGGSNMDLAKFVAVGCRARRPTRAVLRLRQHPRPRLPLVCVPTTAGTGSEVSHAAVLTDRANHIKVSTLSQYLRPALAVVDPALTDGCPRQVTADSGIDALTHAIEAYTADRLRPPRRTGRRARGL